MNDVRDGKVYGLLFVFFLVLLLVGGYIATVYLTKDAKKEEPVEDKKTETLKIEEDKDYLYFLNEETKNESYHIIYQDIKINIDSMEARTIENNLNQAMEDLKASYKLISDTNLSEEEQNKIFYKDSGIYEASYVKYTRFISEDYASLLVDFYEFNCFEGEKYLTSIAYVFDLETGKLLSNNELLKEYNYSLDKLKELVKNHLLEKQETIEVEVEPEEEGEEPTTEKKELIDINSTIISLDNENYALYIDKSGFLTLSYLVKSLKSDYNDSIIIN